MSFLGFKEMIWGIARTPSNDNDSQACSELTTFPYAQTSTLRLARNGLGV